MAFAHSSVIINTGATQDTRTRDQLIFNYLARPQAMTVYVRFILLDDVATNLAQRIFVQVGAQSAAGQRYLVDTGGGTAKFRALYFNATGGLSVSTVDVTGAVIGDTIELRGTLTAAGVVQIGYARNMGTEATGSASSALVLHQNWTAAKLVFNGSGTDNLAVNFAAYRNVEVVAGIQTLQQMRVRAGTD